MPHGCVKVTISRLAPRNDCGLARGGGRPSLARHGFSGAGLGTTMPIGFGPPTVTGTGPATVTTTSASGLFFPSVRGVDTRADRVAVGA